MASQFAKKFTVDGGKGFSLAKINPRDDSLFDDKEKAKAQTAEDAEAINQLQDRLYAEGSRSLLVILQGIDCSGKDGTVRSVFNACGPIGVEVTPFKVPSEEERAHDYLWRVHKACPSKGIIGIFNGMLHIMVERGWIDRDFIANHTVGWEQVEESVKKYTPEYASKIAGVPAEMIVKAAEMWGPLGTVPRNCDQRQRPVWPALSKAPSATLFPHAR